MIQYDESENGNVDCGGSDSLKEVVLIIGKIGDKKELREG